MKMANTALLGVLLIEPRVFSDERRFYYESYHIERYRSLGIPVAFDKDNQS